jgi:hypothetical protein
MKNRKRYYLRKAKDGTYIAIYRWLKKSPAKNPKDIIEINMKSLTNHDRFFIRPDEAIDIMSGLFLALLDYTEVTYKKEAYIPKNEGR